MFGSRIDEVEFRGPPPTTSVEGYNLRKPNEAIEDGDRETNKDIEAPKVPPPPYLPGLPFTPGVRA